MITSALTQFFTSPLEGEVCAKRREGGNETVSEFLSLPPSLTLPLKGGGNSLVASR
jgi:hypothetical protein